MYQCYSIFIFFFCIIFAFAKSIKEPFLDHKVDKYYKITRIDVPVHIDGFENEIFWDKILTLDDFVQDEPINMELPTEKTEVKLVHDDEAIYVFAKLFDSDSEKISKRLSYKDDWLGAFDEVADWFQIDFDSRHDHQTAFAFLVNLTFCDSLKFCISFSKSCSSIFNL